MRGREQGLLRTWGGRLPERARAKGYKGKTGKLLYMMQYVRVKIMDIVARHCPVTVLRESCYRLMGVNIGKGTFVDRDVYFDSVWPELISIGKGSSIAQCTILLCHEYDLESYYYGALIHDLPHVVKPIRIADNVMVGSRAIILPGVTIGEGAVIGAGAVVNKEVLPWCIAVGSPARVVKRLSE